MSLFAFAKPTTYVHQQKKIVGSRPTMTDFKQKMGVIRGTPLIGAEEEWGFRGKKPPLPK